MLCLEDRWYVVEGRRVMCMACGVRCEGLISLVLDMNLLVVAESLSVS